METAPVEAGSVETAIGKLLPDWFVVGAPAGVEAHLPRGEARAPRLGRRGVGTGRGKVSWAQSLLVRAASSAAARSGGSGDDTSIGAAVTGWANASRAAWRNCRSRPRSPRMPY